MDREDRRKHLQVSKSPSLPSLPTPNSPNSPMKTPDNSAEAQLQQELGEMFLIDTQQQLETYFDIIQRLTPESWMQKALTMTAPSPSGLGTHPIE